MIKTRFKNQGGVIIIMALVVLVIASVLAVTFATSMRLEEKTAATFRKHGKVFYIAQAGYEYALAILRKDKNEESSRPYDALNEEWRTLFNGSGEEEEPAVNLDGINSNGINSDGKDARWIYLHRDPEDDESPLIGRFAVLIVDEASKLSLHASGSGQQNQGWTPFENDLTNLKNPNTGASLFDSSTAPNLINYRQGDKTGGGVNTKYPGDSGDDDSDNTPLENDGIDNDGDGVIDEAFEGTNEPDEYVSRIPYGTGDELDFALKLVDELRMVSGIGETTTRMCKNFTTVDAGAQTRYWDSATSSWESQENINALTSVDTLFNLMTGAGISSENAARWTANTIDYGDRDGVPTVIETGGKKYLGVEGLQINEVMSWVNHRGDTYKGPIILDNFVDTPTNWNDPSSFSNNGNWNNALWTAQGNVDGGEDTWTWPWDNGTYDIYIYRDSSLNGRDFHYKFEDGISPGVDLEGDTDFYLSDRYLVPGVKISNGEIRLTLRASVGGETFSWFQCLSLNPTNPNDPNTGTRRNSFADPPPVGPVQDPPPGDPWDDSTWAAKGWQTGGKSTWVWTVSNGTYDVYLYQNIGWPGTNDYDYRFEEGEAGDISGTATFGSSGTNIYYHVGNVTVSGGQLTLKLTACYTWTRSRFEQIGVEGAEYVELVNLSSSPITIDKSWGINVGGNIILDNNTAKIDSSSPGTTYKFTWFEGDAATFTIPGSTAPNYSYFIAADSRYAMDYRHAWADAYKDGVWGSPGNLGNEPGDLGVIGDLEISNTGGVNISLVREVNGEEIVVDFVPCTTTASGFGTSAWDTVAPQEDKSVERNSAYKDDSSWALTTEGWGRGTPGAANTGGASVAVAVKNRPFASPGFMTEVYKGTGDYSTNKLITSDIKDFVSVLTTAYYRLEVENTTSPPGWSTDTGMDGTPRYLSPTAGSNATLSWTGLHIPDGTYNLFVAGGIGGKFQCPSGTARVMRPDGIVYAGTAAVSSGSLTVGVYGDGTNLYSLDYILLVPEKESPLLIGKININTASEQVLNALPPAFWTGFYIIDYRNGADNKDGTTDDNPFGNIGEYLSITGLSEAQLAEAFQKQASLITVHSDIFEIIVVGQEIEDLTNTGIFDDPEAEGRTGEADLVTGKEKIRAIVDRSYDPPRVLYFRREPE